MGPLNAAKCVIEPSNLIKACKEKELVGAARGIRTPDPIITNDVLYQLSYCGFLSFFNGLLGG